ncbi:MAG: hypothetical protein JNL69_01600 [Bacteroidia bacterium]|nr:hypothetical protein [Bacteroidia bacterium]
MLKNISYTFSLLFSIFSSASFSQADKDTVLLLNGTVIISTVVDTTNGVLTIKNKKNPNKNHVIDNERVFSIRNSSGENIIYTYDTLIGNEFTVEEMRYFIKGEQDAEKGFKAYGSLYGNLALGIASGLTGSFFCPIPPFAFVALSGLPKVKIKHKTVSNLEYLKQDPYLMGYERVARKKRKVQSLIGGGVGLAVGLGTWGVLKSTGNDLIK